MGDDVTMQRRLSLAWCIHKLIPFFLYNKSYETQVNFISNKIKKLVNSVQEEMKQPQTMAQL